MTGDTAVYNTAEFYALAVLQACSDELTTGASRSEAMLNTINDVHDRFGSSGLACLVAALGRIGTLELRLRADRDHTTVNELLNDWRQHKLEQHHDGEDDDLA